MALSQITNLLPDSALSIYNTIRYGPNLVETPARREVLVDRSLCQLSWPAGSRTEYDFWPTLFVGPTVVISAADIIVRTARQLAQD